jgi:Rrf2 family transcriptional regulator, cysteine metabolism repressor
VRFSAKAEYACLAMIELASRHRAGQPVQIKTIADTHGISPRFLVQILLQLKGTKLVASSRGAAGGYTLARPPETITLADIISSVDPPPKMDAALKGVNPSPAVDCLRQIWHEIGDAESQILEATTLADLVARAHRRDVSSYQI